MSKKTILYILPHHDDEVFVVPKITSDIRANHNIKFFYLMKSELRLKESHKFLGRLGVEKKDIISAGLVLNVSDGVIHLHMGKIYSYILSCLEPDPIQEIVCTAFEGGHNDHDAASLIARALAKKFNAPLFEFYLYNGHGTKGKFYKVAHPTNTTITKKYPYSFRDISLIARAPFDYLSQIKAMLGLWPFLMLKILRQRPLTLNVLEGQRLLAYNHPEVPLYERWGRMTQKEFNLTTSSFLQFISKQ